MIVTRALLATLLLVFTACLLQDFVTTLEGQVSRPWLRHVIDDSLVGADGVRLADVNGDGLLDVASGWEESGLTRVYLNPGPDFVRRPWPAVTVGATPSVEDAVFADLDGDGFMDVVSSSEGETKKVFVNWAPQDRASYMKSSAWESQVLVVSDAQIQWMFSLPLQIDGLNGLDLVVGSKGPGAKIGWFESPYNPRSLGAWNWHSWVEVGWIMSLIAVDVDGDDDKDIVYSDRIGPDSGCYWLKNPGYRAVKNKPWERHLIGAHGREAMFLTLSDLDQDGMLDVLVPVKPQELLYLRRGSRDGKSWESFSIHFPQEAGSAKSVVVGDVDADGRLDIVLTCEGAVDGRSGVMWMSYERAVTDAIWKEHDISGPQGIKYDLLELIDLDEDGDLDVMTCEERERLGVVWYENPLRSP